MPTSTMMMIMMVTTLKHERYLVIGVCKPAAREVAGMGGNDPPLGGRVFVEAQRVQCALVVQTSGGENNT